MSKFKTWVAAVASGLVAILAFVVWRKWQKDHVDTLTDALVVARAERDVVALTEQKKAALARVEAWEPEVVAIEEKLAKAQTDIVLARTGAAELDSSEILEEYRKLGYL